MLCVAVSTTVLQACYSKKACVISPFLKVNKFSSSCTLFVQSHDNLADLRGWTEKNHKGIFVLLIGSWTFVLLDNLLS
jgi:hypothetical protein